MVRCSIESRPLAVSFAVTVMASEPSHQSNAFGNDFRGKYLQISNELPTT